VVHIECVVTAEGVVFVANCNGATYGFAY